MLYIFYHNFFFKELGRRVRMKFRSAAVENERVC